MVSFEFAFILIQGMPVMLKLQTITKDTYGGEQNGS